MRVLLLGGGDNESASKNSLIGRRRQQYLLGIEREKAKKVESNKKKGYARNTLSCILKKISIFEVY